MVTGDYQLLLTFGNVKANMMSSYGFLELLRTPGQGNRHTELHGLMFPREPLYIMVCVHDITFLLA